MLLLHGTTLCPVRNPTKKENSLMTTGCDQFAFGFQPLKQREIRDEFPGGAIRSDGSGLLLREVEKRTGILRQFGHRCTDFRNPDLIAHTVEDMMAQRVYGLALGYEDLSDPAPFDEVIEHVLHFDMQALGQLFGEITLGGMLHSGFGGG